MTLPRRAALLSLPLLSAAPFLTRPAFGQATDGVAEGTATLLSLGARSLALSQLARERTDTQPVGVFATLEIAEQAALAELLLAAGAPAPALAPDDATAVDAMALLQGGSFDREYLSAQRAAHIEALSIAQRMAARDDMTVPVVTAKVAKAGIEAHLAMIDMIVRDI